MSERYAVAIFGEPGGWIVEADSTEDAIATVRGTVPRAAEVSRGELMVWNESYYRERYCRGGPLPADWTEL